MWPRRSAEKLLKAAVEGDVAMVRKLLEEGTVSVDALDENRRPPLYYASANGHCEIVDLLLKKNATVDAADMDGWTPLLVASEYGYAEIVELLLKATASVDAADTGGRTPLHKASANGHAAIVELLLKTNATVDVSDQWGKTPLHEACLFHHPDVARLLLTSGANLDAKDKDGFTPLHRLLKARGLGLVNVDSDTLHTVQVLMTYGAVWDTKCDEIVSPRKAWDEAPALALCMQLWIQELADGRPLTDVPAEVVERGVESTQEYIDDLKTSLETVLRRKICLVGPSCAGKTSFVKSIITKQPQLEHIDDRTIAIDHFPLRFERRGTKRKDVTIHEVTFWDFAGQDAYQVAHSLFFSPRTLFLVCVDLEAFTVAFLQASIMANMKKQEAQLMGEFIERTVMQWIRMIVARQPDAEFVFIATKEDMLKANAVTERLLKNALVAKLTDVEATTQKMRRKLQAKQSSPADRTVATARSEPKPVFVSCMSSHSIASARTMVEHLISNSNRSFQMPDTYTQALQAIMAMRLDAMSLDITTRIDRMFAKASTLPAKVKLEPKLCKIILQTLHDLGDVLWYEDVGVKLFKDRVILDPMLLIDFIRQVINHNYTGQTMPHTDLKALPYWSGFTDKEQMKAMKQILQKFNLVFSADDDRTMRWDSDLIVPAYWQTKTPASWLWLGDILRINPTKVRISGEQLSVSDIVGINSTTPNESEAVRLHWEFHFEFGLPITLFDHFVVASVSPVFKFDAGPDWIVYEEKDVTACRFMVGRDPKSLHRTIHVEAVVQEVASTSQVQVLWANFRRLVGALMGVLRGYPGLDVSSFAWDDAHDKIGLKRLMEPSSISSECVKWMPPAEHWASIQKIMRQQMRTEE